MIFKLKIYSFGLPLVGRQFGLLLSQIWPPIRKCHARRRVVRARGISFGSKVGQIGPKWDKSGIFFRSDFSTFWLEPKCTEIVSEKVPDWSHLGSIGPTLGANPDYLLRAGDQVRYCLLRTNITRIADWTYIDSDHRQIGQIIWEL